MSVIVTDWQGNRNDLLSAVQTVEDEVGNNIDKVRDEIKYLEENLIERDDRIEELERELETANDALVELQNELDKERAGA